MKRNSVSRKLSVLMLIFGIAALALRKTLYAVAIDAKGLLMRNHPLEITLLALTAVVLIMLLLTLRKLDPSGLSYSSKSAFLSGAIGNTAAGIGILITTLTGAPGMGGALENGWSILGLTAPVCMLLAGISRLFRKEPFFLLHVTVCLFFALHIVAHYQLWSSNPQMQDYVFSLLGAMTLMFYGFYTAAREAGYGSLPIQMGMGLAAIYLCLAELARTSCFALYLGGILWVLADLFSMQNAAADQEK